MRARPVLLDLARFPREATMSLSLPPGRGRASLGVAVEGEEYDLRECEAIWWRRPNRPVLHDELGPEPVRRFAYRECHAALAGLFSAVPTRWVNDPAREDVASRKAFQLTIASEVGLLVPRTEITNDPARARAFLESCRGGDGRVHAVSKTLTPATEPLRYTKRISEADLELLGSVQYAPTVLQDYVDGVDLRVVAVGGDVFAMEMDARRSRHPEDCRADWETGRSTARAAHLPDALSEKLLALMDRLGLAYGAFDLRRRDDGEHVFLEANPSGQWLYVESVTGAPITRAVAQLLAHG